MLHKSFSGKFREIWGINLSHPQKFAYTYDHTNLPRWRSGRTAWTWRPVRRTEPLPSNTFQASRTQRPTPPERQGQDEIDQLIFEFFPLRVFAEDSRYQIVFFYTHFGAQLLCHSIFPNQQY